jgi:hypothetical protein
MKLKDGAFDALKEELRSSVIDASENLLLRILSVHFQRLSGASCLRSQDSRHVGPKHSKFYAVRTACYLLPSCLAQNNTLKIEIETVNSFKKLRKFYKATRRHTPHTCTHIYRSEYLKPKICGVLNLLILS